MQGRSLEGIQQKTPVQLGQKDALWKAYVSASVGLDRILVPFYCFSDQGTWCLGDHSVSAWVHVTPTTLCLWSAGSLLTCCWALRLTVLVHFYYHMSSLPVLLLYISTSLFNSLYSSHPLVTPTVSFSSLPWGNLTQLNLYSSKYRVALLCYLKKSPETSYVKTPWNKGMENKKDIIIMALNKDIWGKWLLSEWSI